MQLWKHYLAGILLAFIAGQFVTLVVAQVGYCPYPSCAAFGWCTTEAGDSQMIACSYWDTCAREWRPQYATKWCCNALSAEGLAPLSIGGCCQYDAQVYTCISTGRTVVLVFNGLFKPGQICNFNTGLCGYYA